MDEKHVVAGYIGTVESGVKVSDPNGGKEKQDDQKGSNFFSDPDSAKYFKALSGNLFDAVSRFKNIALTNQKERFNPILQFACLGDLSFLFSHLSVQKYNFNANLSGVRFFDFNQLVGGANRDKIVFLQFK